MALQSSGAISLDDIHVEAGGSTGTSCTLNDTDIRGLTAGDGQTINSTSDTEIDIGDFYGATNAVYMAASGGNTITTSGNYKYHKFTSSGTFTVNTVASGAAPTTVDYLIIAGGGAGGQAYTGRLAGGGGGAGGYKTGSVSVTSTGGNTITVGAGHPTKSNDSNFNYYGTIVHFQANVPDSGARGSNSSALGVTSTGGGIGGAYYNKTSGGSLHQNPQTGGSGGGAHSDNNSGAASVGGSQGNSGGNSKAGSGGGGGGKGGSGGQGVDDGNGGSGGSGSSTGNANSGGTRGGGGGGGSASGNGGSGGSGGGGSGGSSGNNGSAASANTGGGGGGAPGYPFNQQKSGGAGGSGIVILRYQYQGS